MLLQLVFDLEIRLAHLDKWLGVVTASDDATVVIAQYHDGHLCQIRTKDPLATCVEAIAVNQCEDWRIRHDFVPCW